MAALTQPKKQYEIESFYPAGTLVEAATSPSPPKRWRKVEFGENCEDLK